jgi:cytochrome P450 family 142 subfamily A polypeptide 1
LHGVDIPVDATVTLLLGSANRDPRRWGAEAAEFDADRDTSGHVAFGFGPHFCLGAALARLELEVSLTTVLDRLPDIRLVDDAEPLHRPANFISGYESMPVRFAPTAPIGVRG